MNISTALGTLSAAIALLLINRRMHKNAGVILSSLVLLLGFVLLAESLLGLNYHIDDLFTTVKMAGDETVANQQPSARIVGFLLTGLSLIFFYLPRQNRKMFSDSAATLVFLIGFLSFAGHVYNVETLYSVKSFSSISFPATLSFLFLSLGIILAGPSGGFLGFFNEDTGAAREGGRLLIWIFSILIGVGWFCNIGISAGFFNGHFAISIMIFAFIVSFFFVIRSGVINLSRSEREKNRLLEQNEKNTTLIRDVFERVNDPFIALDRKGRFTYVNVKAGLLGRRDPATLIGKFIWDEFPELRGSAMQQAFEESMGMQKFRIYTGHYAPLGIWHEDFIYPSPEGLSVFIRDISDKRKVEMEREENRLKYRSLFENSSDAILLTIPDGEILSANPAACTIFGMTEEELIRGGRKGIVDTDDPNLPVLLRERRDKGHVRGELEFKRKDGTKFPGEITSVIFSDAAGNERSSMIIRDISERKRAEKKVRDSEVRMNDAQRIARIGSWELDLETSNLVWSAEIYRIFEIDPSQFTPSYNAFLGAIHPDDREMVNRTYNESIRQRTPYSVQHRLLFPDGRIKFVEEQCETIYDDRGRPIRSLGTVQDITEWKRVDEELRKSEVKYRTLMQQAGDAIILFDEKAFILETNESAGKLMGYDAGELIGLNLTEFVFPEDLRVSPLRFEQLDRGEPTISRRSLRRKDGKIVEAELHVKKLSEGYYLGAARDLTDRLKAEEQLRQSEYKYRSLIEQASDGILVAGFSGEIIEVNTALCTMFGYTREEAFIMNVTYFLDPDELKTKPLRFDLLQTDRTLLVERRGIHKNGSVIDIELNSKLTGDGKILSIIRDISERKKAEHVIREQELRFRSLVDTAPDATVIMDEQGVILIANRQAVKLFGYSKSQFEGMQVEKLLPSSFRQKHAVYRKQFAGYARTRPMGAGKDLVAVRMDGTEIPVEISLSPFESQEGILVTASIRDITQRKKAEKELEDSYNSIRRLTEHLQKIREEERTAISREIHDELGQQLTVLKIDASWIKKRLQQKDDAVIRRTDDMLDMVDQMIRSVRRISSELRPSVLDDIGLGAAIEMSLHEFERRSGILTSFDSNLNDRYLPDAVKNGMFRIFQESLTNVARHSHAKKVVVNLSVAGDSWVLRIEDDGVGFDPEAAAAKKTLGVLGMRERAAAIGGEYTISGIPGKGTTIELSIPIGHAMTGQSGGGISFPAVG